MAKCCSFDHYIAVLGPLEEGALKMTEYSVEFRHAKRENFVLSEKVIATEAPEVKFRRR